MPQIHPHAARTLARLWWRLTEDENGWMPGSYAYTYGRVAARARTDRLREYVWRKYNVSCATLWFLTETGRI